MGARDIAGVVLAGGKSSRMGSNKALLEYNGVALLDHMIGLLKCLGISDVYVSGTFDGYRCIPDSKPYEGPACAISNVLSEIGEYDGVLFVPVDMPLLNDKILGYLLNNDCGAFFKGFPLPAFISGNCEHVLLDTSVHELLGLMNVEHIEMPEGFSPYMKNINTPKEWEEVIGA